MPKRTVLLMGLIILVVLNAKVSWGEVDQATVEKMNKKIDAQAATIEQQQRTIQQLLDRMGQLESKIDARPSQKMASPSRVNLEDEEVASISPEQGESRFPILEWGGYIDVGYIDQTGDGSSASSSIHVNSRGDTLSSIGLDGDSTFLVNEVNLNLKAHVSEQSDVIISFDILPRDFSITETQGTASTDDVELDLAYLVYSPKLKSNTINDALFGDLRLSIGKFESPLGIEYRVNNSPDRVNISSSHHAVYTTGYPLGLRARGNLFQDKLKEFHNSIFTYNFVVANAESFQPRHGDGDIDDNNGKTFMTRLSYGLDTLDGFFELGSSLSTGARISQGDNDVQTEQLVVDARFERGPLTLRGEYDYADEDRKSNGKAVIFKGFYGEGYYVFNKPDWLPQWIPMASITPYYRFDTRDFISIPLEGSSSITDVKRHTYAFRYIPKSGNIIKVEYQDNVNSTGDSVDDNLLLMSFIREF